MTFISWRVVLLLAIGASNCVDAQRGYNKDSSLTATAQCNTDGSLMLEFPSKVVGKMIMYNEVIFHGDWIKKCEERRVNEGKQLLKPGEKNPDPRYDDDIYSIQIYEHGNESGNKIVLRRDDMPRHYDASINCHDKEGQNYRTVQFNEISLPSRQKYSQLKFTIGDTTFRPRIKRGKFAHFGDSVKMEIKIRDENLSRPRSRLFESCKLDILDCNGHAGSVSIIENSSLTPEGRAIEFRAQYTPSTSGYHNRGHNRGHNREHDWGRNRGHDWGRNRRYKRGYKPAKSITVEFRAFALANRKSFNFNCKISGGA